MTTAHLNAAPRAIFQGIKNEGGGRIPAVPESLPVSLPHLFLFTSEGDLEPQLVSGASALRTFGSDVFNERGKFTTHQTIMAKVFNENANAIMIQRLKPHDANGPATLTLSLEVVADDLVEYARDGSGRFIVDANGNKTETGSTIPGHKLRWHLGTTSPTQVFGERGNVSGALTGTGGTQSTVYPILDMEVSSFGSHGNLKGIRLWAPTTRTTGGTDTKSIDENDAFIYKMQMIKKLSETSQPRVVETNSNAQSVDFMFKEGAVSAGLEDDLDIEDVLLDSYRNMEVQPKQFGPFNNLHVYRDNIEIVSTLIYELEKDYQLDWVKPADEAFALVNMVGGENVDGIPYHTVKILGRADGGIELTPNSNHYAKGGSDGTMNNEVLNELVYEIMSDYPCKDMAYYPQSSLWDSGFDMKTTRSLFNVLGLRPDMYVVAATQDAAMPQNTDAQDTSAGFALQSAARAFPESVIFGTSTCRAIIIRQSGYLRNSKYKGLLPLTVDFAAKVAAYMGAGNGVFKRNLGFDEAPYNQINMFKPDTINGTFKLESGYFNDWDAGLVWAQTFDRSKLFYPQFQTVFNDSTSPMNSFINMTIAVEAQKVCDRAWRRLTGGSRLTPDQFLDRSDELITEMMSEDRFEERVIVRPRTIFTDIDKALGYSWETVIDIYMNNMMLVGTYTVVSKRRADFAG